MLKFINLKKSTVCTLVAILAATSLISKSATAVPGCNNGIGNNFDVPYTLRGQTYTIRIDPGNNGQMKQFKNDLKERGFNDFEIASAVAQLVDAEMRANAANCDGSSSSSSSTASSASTSSTAPTIPAPTTPVPTRVIVNPSFESPSFTSTTWYSLDNYIPGDDTTLQGWFSTHPTTGFRGDGDSRFKDSRTGQNFKHLVEIWANSFQDVSASEGKQFAELNAQANSALYQDILVFAGEEIPWSASHRGRGSARTADVAEISISDPDDWTGTTFSGTKLYSALMSTAKDGNPKGITATTGSKDETSSQKLGNTGWVKYSDTWVGPSVTKKYRFAFQSVSTGSGDNTVGNFLDDIQIKLSPVVDLVDPNISQVNPIGNSVYYLPVRINGKLDSEATVEINVALNGDSFSDYTLSALVSGTNSAVYNGVTASKLSNGKIQVTIPSGIYDPNNPENYILVPINFNQVLSESDKTTTFTITDANGGGGSGSQNLLIPPADSGLITTLDTTVTSVNRLPNAEDDGSQTDKNQAVTINVLDNDSDPDNDTLTLSVNNPAYGQVNLNADNTVTYTPNSDYVGDDTFTYTISDGEGGTATANVNVIVNQTTPTGGGGGAGGGAEAGDGDGDGDEAPSVFAD